MVTIWQKFLNGLYSIRGDFNEEVDEIIAFAEVMARKHTTLELDENGFFFVSASGSLEEIIPVMYKQIEKLERIKKAKDGNH